jgi:hypothetical protein
MTAGVATITLATFFPSRIAQLVFFSRVSAPELVFFGLFAGGLVSGAGVMLTVAGTLRRRGGGSERLAPSLVALAVSIVLFFTLFYLSCSSPTLPPLRPGETVTI